jgi:hydrogenase maturation factor
MSLTSNEIMFEGQVSKIEDSPEGKIGWVVLNGARVMVSLSLLPAVHEGDTVLVQGRFALSAVEESHEIR